jgi:hypothetical protein
MKAAVPPTRRVMRTVLPLMMRGFLEGAGGPLGSGMEGSALVMGLLLLGLSVVGEGLGFEKLVVLLLPLEAGGVAGAGGGGGEDAEEEKAGDAA